ncbi:MAG: sugar phosphate isomerase/epimerase [Bacteroidales bacterium]|nr:sugar phosphate isomerase/epimerase [Bacteroidales bacterium]
MKSRRDFIKASGLGIAGAAALQGRPFSELAEPKLFGHNVPFELGIASYTFRKYSLEATLEMTKRLGIKHIAFKSFHLELDSTDEQIKEVVKKVNDAGIILYGGGVIYMKNEEEIEHAFEYAKKAGMKVIIGVPGHDLIYLVDEKVKKYDIKVAIHNHGPGDEVYPTAESIYEKIEPFDSRIGICLDVGHTQRVGEDPVNDLDRFFDRILDVHLKDESEPTPEGKPVEMGHGCLDIPEILRVLVAKGYKGIASFEYEKDPEDVLPGLAESVGYVRGVLDAL